MHSSITFYETAYSMSKFYKDIMNDFRPSNFMDYVNFCTSHKATVKRIKRRKGKCQK